MNPHPIRTKLSAIQIPEVSCGPAMHGGAGKFLMAMVQITETAESGDDDSGEEGDQQAGKGGTAGKSTEKPPTRFFATIPLDPDRVGFEVARIMDAFLVELTRSPDFSVRVMLDLAGHAGEEGYPKGVVEIVKANVRDLKIDQQPIDFGRWG